MRIGCDLPYLADPGEIRYFAQAAEEIGYDHLGFSEHVASSRTTEYPRMFSFDDQWHEAATLLGFLAGITERIELNPSMYLATLRPPVLVAKQLAEIDLLSRQRLRVGMSVSWNREEQVALGVDPATRGRRLDELVPLLRRLWSEDSVSFDGEFVQLDQVGIHPRPVRPIPIWIGGGDMKQGGFPPDAAVARAGAVADGFKMMAPTGLDPSGSLELAERLHACAADHGRTISVETRLSPQMTEPDGWSSVLRQYRESGLVSHVGVATRLVRGTVEDQVALVREVADRTRAEW